jgi:hypothetical protein
VIGTFPDSFKPNRNSPAPSAAARPSSSRARNNSTAQEQGRQRAASTTSLKPVSNGPAAELSIPDTGPSGPLMTKVRQDSSSGAMPGAPEVESEAEPPKVLPPIPNGMQPETTVAKPEEREPSVTKKEVATPIVPPPPPPPIATTVTTKSRRASKPSTPALGTFAEAAPPKPRPSRASESAGTTVKRSHKKGASQSAAAMQAIMQQAVQPPTQSATKKQEGRTKAADDDEEAEGDENEPKYCYCRQVSYGEMVACDDKNCEKEWFHLGCVGLKVAPRGEWFCPDCTKRHKMQGKKTNGR